MFKRFGIAVAAVACGGAMLAAPASAQTSDDEMVKSYRAELAPLNAPGSGHAEIEVVNRQASVSIQASNLSPAVAPHAQHIHGTLGGANTCPDPDNADADGDGLVTTAEGVPFYGGIQVSLTTEGDTSPESALAVERFPTTEQGAYSYDRTIPLSRSVADAFGNLHIVVHGIDLNRSGEYDGERRSSLTDELPLEATIPTACGAIKLTDIDLPARYEGASGIEGTVVRLYVSMLDRIPDPSGFEYWVNQLEGDANIRTVARAFTDSDEFEARYGEKLDAPLGEWVDFVYSAVLGRIADPSGRQYWINQVEAGALSRTELLILFSESAEFKSLTGTDGQIDLQRSCQSPDGFSMSYPAEWEAVSDCGQFGPAPVEEPEQGTDERTGVVSAYVDPVSFNEVSQPVDGEQSRAISTVDGLQAVRVESQSTGDGLYPAGTASVTWMVDLSVGVDDEPATLFVNAVDILDDVDFDRAVTTMDRMVRSLQIMAGDTADGENVVARYEGGGTPFTVAAAPAATQPTTCLRLVDGDGIACVEAVDSTGDVALTGLDGPAGPITVGITSSDVFAIELSTEERTMTFLPVSYPARDSMAFALPVDADELESVTLRAIDGTVIAQPDPAAARRPAGA